MKRGVQCQRAAVALLAYDAAMAGRVPLVIDRLHLVAAGTAFSRTRFIIEAGARHHQDHGQHDQPGGENEPPHERTLEPFQAFNRRSEARYALARMVSAGLKPPFVTCTLASMT